MQAILSGIIIILFFIGILFGLQQINLITINLPTASPNSSVNIPSSINTQQIITPMSTTMPISIGYSAYESASGSAYGSAYGSVSSPPPS